MSRKGSRSQRGHRPERREAVAPRVVVARGRDLVAGLLCVLPPLYLTNRLPTLHTVTDNKWLLIVCLAGCEVCLIVLAWAMQPATTSRRGLPAERVALLVGTAAFLLAHALSISLSREPGYSLRGAIPSLLLIVLFGAIAWQPPPARRVRKWIGLLVATATLVGLIALAQHAGIDPLAGLFRYADPERFRTGVYATLGNPEYLGGYLAPMALVAFGLAATGSRWPARAAALTAGVVAGVPALLSGSRGAFLGLLAGGLWLCFGALAVSPWLSRRASRAGLAAAGATVILLAAALVWAPPSGPIGLLRKRLADIADPHSESIRDRIVFNLVGLEMVAQRPLVGVGAGMYGSEFYRSFYDLARRDTSVAMQVLARDFSGKVAEHAHNDWLEFWAETGTLGLAAWLWILVVWLVAVIRAIGCTSMHPRERMLLVALSAAVVALLVNATFNFPLHEPVRATVFWLLLAWTASLAFTPEKRKSGDRVLISL